MGHWRVGIDLGTTHTVVAFAGRRHAKIRRFPIPQLIALGELTDRPFLPSVRYHPLPGELPKGAMALPWRTTLEDPVSDAVFGELALKLGSKSPERLVVSAKSWLAHSRVDRTAPILPWGAPAEVPKISPLEAQASYLRYVRAAWNHHHPEVPLEAQEVVLTLPASFDDAARLLTLEAAKMAGLQVRLLEEPQAVCYDWLWRNRHHLKAVERSHLILVVDLGGGTLDLSLIHLKPGPVLKRIAVGDHLLLGGDNIDAYLAHIVEERLLERGERFSPVQFAALVEQCRRAKEQLLKRDAPAEVRVTLLGAGRQLVGGARSVVLKREEVQRLVLDGFFPEVDLDDLPEGRRSGLIQFGLPYVADPAVTRHIAAFLHRHATQIREITGRQVPDTLLLSGGVFQSPLIVQRLQKLLSRWAGHRVTLLDNPHPDFAVASGAVASLFARHGSAPKIEGGAARSYFLIVTGSPASGGSASPTEEEFGLCLLPAGTPEGEEITIPDRRFALRVGQPVRFDVVYTSDDTAYDAGELVPLGEELRQNRLPPLIANLPAEGGGGEVEVELAAQLTSLGTLQLACLSPLDPAKRWRLEFQLRKPLQEEAPPKPPSLPGEALDLIEKIFGRKPRSVEPALLKTLRQRLEKILGPRGEWPLERLRPLADALIARKRQRRRTEHHERLWLSLTGFSLRPGFGAPLDRDRIEAVWPLYREGLQYRQVIQNWAEWWTFWRRISGGLDQARQLLIFEELRPFLDPKSARRGSRPKEAKLRSYENMVRLAGALERLPVEDKVELGDWLLRRLKKGGEPQETAWALGRIGNRVPFYAGVHEVVPRDVVEGWLAELLELPDLSRQPVLLFAIVLMARMSGDRVRDVAESLRQQVLKRLRKAKAPTSWLQMVSEVSPLSEEDERRIFGEALPPGLKLLI